MRALGLERGGAVRAGFLHYTTEAEVDRLLEALAELLADLRGLAAQPDARRIEGAAGMDRAPVEKEAPARPGVGGQHAGLR